MRYALCSIALSVLAGCGGPAQLVIDQPDYLFDTVEGPPSVAAFVLSNAGGQTIHALHVSLAGDLQQFTITKDGCSGAPLDPGATCPVEVTLQSDLEGAFEARLFAIDDEVGGPSLTAHLRGRVSPARLTSTTPANGSAGQGDVANQTVTITNSGGARSGPIVLATMGVSAGADGCSGRTLAGGESCQVDAGTLIGVDQTGAAFGTVTASASPGGTITVSLSWSIKAQAVLQLTGLDLGMLDPALHEGHDVTLTNLSAIPTGELSINLTAPPSMDEPMLTLDSGVNASACTGNALAPHQSCTVRVHAYWPSGSARDYTTAAFTRTLTAAASGTRTATSDLTAAVIRKSAHVVVSYAGAGMGRVDDVASDMSVTDRVVPNRLVVDVANHASLTLTAVPSPGSVFTGWGGTDSPCSGTSPVCTFIPAYNSDVALIATFDKQ
jgi:hypothetical protein